jgi:hypothetical protein
MTASHVFVLFAGIAMGTLLRIATFRAATLMLFRRIIDRQALFLMEWKGEGARAAALQAAERERWRVSPEARPIGSRSQRGSRRWGRGDTGVDGRARHLRRAARRHPHLPLVGTGVRGGGG